MSGGSGLFKNKKFQTPHLAQGGHGVSEEVKNLRADLLAEFAPLAALTVEEFTNPATGGAADLLVATATTVAVQSYLPAGLIAGGLAKLAAFPRNLTFTTAGSTPSDAPANVVVTGTYRGKTQTETINLAQTATIATGLKPFSTITSIVYAAGDGTGATVSIGIGAGVGVASVPKSRAGLAALIREISAGSLVTNGALTAAGLYTPNSAPNGSTSYAIYYEYDPSVVLDQ